jgi:Fe-S cluster assembly ATP-binding protein
MLLEIKNLHVEVEGKQILKGVNLQINRGETHVIMGRNGSGKTTLSNTIMGHPRYRVTQGAILLDGEDITGLSPDERARKRIFLGFQYPVAVPGVTVSNFLRTAVKAVRGDEVPAREFRTLVKKECADLQVPESFMSRFLNEGFSGGEKKRLETLQLRLLQPKLAILDETDSGLDIDALRTVAESIAKLKSSERGILLITHYQRMLNYIKPDHVHVFMDGRILESGGAELALQLEEKGYEAWAQ